MLIKINKIIEYGLYILVFLLSLQTRWIIKLGESEYSTISLYGTDILLILLLFLFVVHKFYSHKLRVASCELRVYWWLILGLDLAIFISIFFAEDKIIAIYKYAVFLLGIGLFWLIVSASYNKLKLIYCFLSGIFLQACFGVWQFLTQSSFACKWLGMAEHDAGKLGTSVIETISSINGIGERWLRAYGGLDHPNILGGVLVVGLLLMINLIIKNRKINIPHSKFSIFNFQFSNNFQFSIFKQNIIFYFFILTSYFLLLTSIFFTFSRGAWLGLIIGVIAMLAIVVVKKNLLAQKKLLEIILISSALIFILFSQFQDLVFTRLSQDTRLEVKSNVERIESYKDSWELIKDNWLFGVGIGNYVVESKKFPPKADQPLAEKVRSKNYNKQGYFYQPVHNVFLLIWAEIGIIGLLFFINFLLFAFYFSLKRFQNHEYLSLCKLPLLTAMTIMFMIDHWWWSLHFGVLLFWFVLGLIAQKRAVVSN